MSASLVGSEMCIRDRRIADGRRLARVPEGGKRGPEAANQLQREARAHTQARARTHARAHARARFCTGLRA
eukprot:15447641-Alexandrium_andersonii.AAC.1